MNILALRVPMHRVVNNQVRGSVETLYYTVCLDQARVRDYQYSTLIPKDTVFFESVNNLFKKEWDSKEFNVSFTQKDYMNDFNSLKVKKQVITGLIKTHPIIEELLDKTPIHHDKRLIADSMRLIKLSRTIHSYDSIIPNILINDYLEVKQYIDRVKPVNTELNLLSLKNGLTFNGPSLNEFKKGFSIRNWPDQTIINFTNSFYTLGPLARLSLELENLWNK